MPVVAAVGGIASAAAGAGAVTAAGGFAAMSLGSAIVAGVQIVSGVAATLGAITGNKTLQKIGLVGAVASTAISGLNSLSNGSLLGGGEAAAGAASKAASGVSQGLDWNSITSASNAADSTTAGLLGSVDQTSAAIDAANAAAGYGAADKAAKVAQSGADVTQQAAVAGVPAPTGASAEMAAQTNYALNTGSDALRMPGLGLKAGRVQLPPAPKPSSGLLGSVLDFTKDNPEAVKMVTGLGGGLAQGYMQQRAEAAKLEAQEAARRRYNASILNQGRV